MLTRERALRVLFAAFLLGCTMPNEPPDPLDVLILAMLRGIAAALETSPSSTSVTGTMRAQVLVRVQQAIADLEGVIG
jgi:hypothetical protein